jgi:hypothetical protein
VGLQTNNLAQASSDLDMSFLMLILLQRVDDGRADGILGGFSPTLGRLLSWDECTGCEKVAQKQNQD